MIRTDIDQPGKSPETATFSPIRVVDIYGGMMPEQPQYYNDDARALYYRLGISPLTTQINDHDVLVATPPLKGMELQTLFHLAAPSKTFGIDYGDTQRDWNNLYNRSDYAELLKNHQQIPNWDVFELYREELLNIIKADHDGGVSGTLVVPVIRVKQSDGETAWNFDELPEESLPDLQNAIKITDGHPIRFLPVLGPTFIAAFSPQITQTESWGPRLSYKLKPGTGQDMGATQEFALSLAKAEELLTAPLTTGLAHFADYGTLPETENSDEDEPKAEKKFNPKGETIFVSGKNTLIPKS
jgi:hypothetical protein